jgi:hypothetical protein
MRGLNWDNCTPSCSMHGIIINVLKQQYELNGTIRRISLKNTKLSRLNGPENPYR